MTRHLLIVLAAAETLAACGTQSTPEPRAASPAPYDTGARHLPTDRPDPVALRRSLTSGDYDQLERVYTAYQDSINLSPRYERHLNDFAQAFWVTDTGIGTALDQWVAARPTSPAALVARAGHRVRLGWAARGGGWANETPDSNFRAMRKAFADASVDLRATIDRDPRSMLAYLLLIELAHARGDVEAAREFLRRSIAIVPGTEVNRILFMAYLAPRWGGSYEQMGVFADECDSAVAFNPRLASMRAFLEYERARELLDEQLVDSARAVLDKAVVRGDLRGLHELRGDLAERAGEHLQAVKSYDRVLAFTPNDASVLHARSYAAMQVVRQSLSPRLEPLLWQAVRDGERAAELEPWNAELREWGDVMRQTEAELRRRSQ